MATGGVMSMPIAGVTIPIGGRNAPVDGGGLCGLMPPPMGAGNRNFKGFVIPRAHIIYAWDRVALKNSRRYAQTPFRLANNMGDKMSRQAYVCGGSPQASQSRPGVYGMKGLAGSIHDTCDGTGVNPATCNTRWVSDGSEYTRFLKLRAINRNMNNITNGGNQYSAQQSAIRAVRTG